jgi:hypothetical protein
MIYTGSGYTVYKAAEEAFTTILRYNNPPSVFVRANKLVQAVPDADTGIPIIRELTEDILTGELSKIVMFYRTIKGDDGDLASERPAPKEVLKFILYNSDKSQVPALDNVTNCPIINLSNGDVQTDGGYNWDLRAIYIKTCKLNLSIPSHPTKKDLDDAFDYLVDVLIDFSFVTDADRANMIGLMFSTVLRSTLKDVPYPMPIISKPIQGCGSTKLSKTIGYLMNGLEPGMSSLQSDEELEKKLLGSAMHGENIIIYDNISGPLYSAILAKQITSTKFYGRILGKTGNVVYPFSPVWCANGVNVVANDDMPRRCYPINLDPEVAQPWTLTGWKHEDYDEYILENRSKILSVLFTIIRYWVQNGKPQPHENVSRMGSFEKFREVIGGIMSLSEKFGTVYLTNVKTIFEECDPTADRWMEFLTEWHKIWKFSEIRTSDIIKQCDLPNSEIKYCLPSEILNARSKDKDFGMAIGRSLSKVKGRIYKIDIELKAGSQVVDHEEKFVKIESKIFQGAKKYSLHEVIQKSE